MLRSITSSRILFSSLHANAKKSDTVLQRLPAFLICNSYQEQQRNFKNFGHNPRPANRITKLYYSFLGLVFTLSLIDYDALKKIIFPDVRADSSISEKISSPKNKDIEQRKEGKDTGDEEEEIKKKYKKEKVGFRDRKL